MARIASAAARRGRMALVTALATVAFSACTGDRSTAPARRAAGGISASLSVDAATPGLKVRLSALSAAGGRLLIEKTILLDTPGQTPATELSFDLAPCLEESPGNTCSLRITAALLSAADATLDQAQAGPISLAPGETKTVTEPLQLREVSRVAVTPPTVELEVGATQTLTATPLNALDVPVVRPAPAWATADANVATVTAGVVTARAIGGPIAITATVGQRTGSMSVTVISSPIIRVAPGSATFTANQGETTPRQATFAVTNGGQAVLRDLTASVTNVSPATPPRQWLAAALNQTTAPAQLTVTADPTGLAGGTTYVSDVVIRSSSRADVAPVAVRITLTVLQQPSIVLNPTRVSFAAVAGAAVPPPQTVAITNGGSGTLDGLRIVSVLDPATGLPASLNWLSMQLSGTVAPASLTLQPLTTTPAGTYAVRIEIASTASGITNSPQFLDVTYVVSAPLVLRVAPPSLTFNALQLGTVPSPQSVSVTSSGPAQIDGLEVSAVSQPWLSATLSGTTTPVQLSVQPTTTNLVPGTYAATITLRSTTLTSVLPQTVGVTYVIAPSGVSVSGRVYSATTNTGIAGATVVVTFAGNPVNSAITDASGVYTLQVPTGTGYTLTIQAPGFTTTSVVSFDVPGPTTAPGVPLSPVSASTGTISGTAINGITGQPIGAGVLVELRPNIANRSGTPIASQVTNTLGTFAFPGVPAGTYTILGRIAGFIEGVTTVVSIGGTTTAGQDVVLIPTIPPGTVRIVLRWGAVPTDLDAHLTYPVGSGRGWVNFSTPMNCAVDPVCLDVDDQDSYGPETMTIRSVGSGIYRYYVHNYSGHFGGDAPLSQSNAVVEVYSSVSSSPIATFRVPQLTGVMWYVFELNGTTITPVNTMVPYSGTQPARVGSPTAPDGPDQSEAASLLPSIRQKAKRSSKDTTTQVPRTSRKQ